jgi:hypothetical protein
MAITCLDLSTKDLAKQLLDGMASNLSHEIQTQLFKVLDMEVAAIQKEIKKYADKAGQHIVGRAAQIYQTPEGNINIKILYEQKVTPNETIPSSSL